MSSHIDFIHDVFSQIAEIKMVFNERWATDGAKIVYTDSVHNTFNSFGLNHPKYLSFPEFAKGIQSVKKLSDEECMSIFLVFDKDANGKIEFKEFMSKMIIQMNPERYSKVKAFFDRIDIDKTGTITVMDFIKNKHNIRGAWFMTHIIGEYNDANKNVITFGEFINFYSDLSMFYKGDEEFFKMLDDAWVADKPCIVSIPVARRTPNELLTLLKDALNKKWSLDGGKIMYTDSVYNTFKDWDYNPTNKLCFFEFSKGVKKILPDFDEQDCNDIFSLMDSNGDDRIVFNEFMSKIHTQLSPKRYNFIKRVFDSIDTDHSGVISACDFKIPVSKGMERNGSKNTDTLSYYLREVVIKDYTADDKITFSEFINFYTDFSLSLVDDCVFMEFVKMDWNLDHLYD